MAIEPNDLKLRSGDTSILFNGSHFIMEKRWEVYHSTLGDVVESGTESMRVPTLNGLSDGDAQLQNRAESGAARIQEIHRPISAIGAYSAFDADLILDDWMQDGSVLSHPICGDISAIPADLIARVNTILGSVLPPPTWFWAEPYGTGQIRVKCVAVTGATSYNVYDGDTLLGSVQDHDWSTISVTDGFYTVRMAGVTGGKVGILSFPIYVTIGTVAAMTAPEPIKNASVLGRIFNRK